MAHEESSDDGIDGEVLSVSLAFFPYFYLCGSRIQIHIRNTDRGLQCCWIRNQFGPQHWLKYQVCFVNKMLKLYVAVDMDRLLPVPVLTFFVCRRTEFGKTCGCSGRADRSRSRRRRWVETSVVEPIRVYLFLRLWLLLRCTNKKLKKNNFKKILVRNLILRLKKCFKK